MFEEIRAIIAEQLGKKEEDIKLETKFKEDLNADSLDLFQIMNDIEDKYDVKIENAENIVTVGDALKLVQSQKS